jgi:pSer/pThr/pTyr-binding forkhead associated (FHA) protein
MPLRLRLLPASSPPGQAGGPTEPRVVELPDDAREVRIGRRPDLELPLPYPALSALHARLALVDGRWQIEDLGSTNGTRVDGQGLPPRQARPIGPGAQIVLGQVTLVFDGVVGTIAGAEGTATIARRLVNDLFAASPDLATPTLVIVSGVPARAPLRLEAMDRRYVAGRAETCDLQLRSEEISREHVEIVRRWDGVVVRDLDSKNGVRVNDALITEPRRVQDGDLVQVGPATLRLSDPADRYLRDFEARASQSGDGTPGPSTAIPASAVIAASSPVDASAPAASGAAAAASPATPAASAAPLAAAAVLQTTASGAGARTATIVAAVVLVVIGVVVAALVFGG